MIDMTVGSLLRDAAGDSPDSTALVMGNADAANRPRWTFHEMLERAETTAKALLTHFSPGDRVAIWAPNVNEFFDLEFGTALAGMTLVPLNPLFQSKEAQYPLALCEAKGIFFKPQHRNNPIAEHVRQLVDDLPELKIAISLDELASFNSTGDSSMEFPVVDPSSAAQIQFTSGTTGRPKGVVFHHRGMTNMARFACTRLGVTTGAVWVNPNPLFHASGCALSTIGPLTMPRDAGLP